MSRGLLGPCNYGSGSLRSAQVEGSISLVPLAAGGEYPCFMNYRANRKANLIRLMQGFPSLRAFTDYVNSRLGPEQQVNEKYLYQVLSGFQGAKDKKPRSLGDDYARRIAAAFGYQETWMDQDHAWAEDKATSPSSPRPFSIPAGNLAEHRDVAAWFPSNDPLPDGYVTIDAVELEVGAGSRLVITEAPEKKLRLFDAEFFVSRRTRPDLCKAYRVAGDSMRPFLYDRDWIVVDTSRRNPPGPGVTDERLCTFVLRVDTEVMVKMVHRMPGGSLRISSVNPDPKYAMFSVPAGHLDTVEIWGAYLERSGGRSEK